MARRRAAQCLRLLAAFALSGGGLLGCGEQLQVNLIIYDPCNQAVLSAADQIEVSISSPELSEPETTTWAAASGQGEFSSLPLVPDATVTVVARSGNLAVGAGSVGLIDLSGKKGETLVELSVTVGRTDSFATTTDTRGSSACTELVAKRHGHTATRLPDGRVFISGGERIDRTGEKYWQTTELYDPKTGAFEQGPEMDGWTRKGHAATLLLDGRVLVTGGVGVAGDNLTTWKVAQIYDPLAGTFTSALHMMEQRAFHTATLLDDGRVLLAGGSFGSRELATTEIFDPASESFSAGPTLLEPRTYHAAVRVAPDTVALVGGRGSGQVLGTVEFVRLSPTQVIAGPDLSVPRSHLAAAVSPGGDAIIVAGGFTAVVDATEEGTGTDSIEVVRFDPNSLLDAEIVCPGLKLAAARGAAGIAEIANGLVLVGGISQPAQVLATAERIRVDNLATCDINVIPTLGSMATPRAWPVLTELPGGDILVTGGITVASGSPMSLGQGEVYIQPR